MTAYYIFISHGPNPRLRQAAYLETLRPWKNVMAYHTRYGRETKREVYYDYARVVRGLSSIPKLRALLEASTERQAGFLTDDFRRIFSRCALEKRNLLHDEICELGDYFIDLRTPESLQCAQQRLQTETDCLSPRAGQLSLERTGREGCSHSKGQAADAKGNQGFEACTW